MSTIKVSTISPLGTDATKTITIGTSGDKITLPSSATLTNFPGVPAFAVRKTGGDQSYSQNTATKVTFDTELLDTNDAFASDKFTVPSGHAGTYSFHVSIMMGAISADSAYEIKLYLNGSSYTTLVSYITDESENPIFAGVQSLSLSEGDYVEVYGTTNGGAGNFKDDSCQFTGFKLGA